MVLLLAEKGRVLLKGEVPDYIHATFIHVSNYFLFLVLTVLSDYYRSAFLDTLLLHAKLR